MAGFYYRARVERRTPACPPRAGRHMGRPLRWRVGQIDLGAAAVHARTCGPALTTSSDSRLPST